MSTAFYKSTPPRLLKSFINSNNKRSIEVWNTTCIVTNFGKNQKLTACQVLINPANPELSGVKNFPYFPKGGPVPEQKPKSMHADWQPLGFVSNWGGMEVGSGMLYPASVIDGLVHQLGGMKLALECKLIGSFAGCPTGTAVSTSHADEALKMSYDQIVHTAPPFYKQDEHSIEMLNKCYVAAFDVAFEKAAKVACPLIGAGARGFPVKDALNVAVTESLTWKDFEENEVGVEKRLLFGIPDVAVAEEFVEALECAERTI